MNRITERESDCSSRKFVVTLSLEDGDAPRVRCSDLIGRGFRTRTSFGQNAGLYDVFIKEIADSLSECLANIGQETEIVSFQDLVIETPGLTLSGAHMLVKRDGANQLHIIFRFRFFLGSINRAFVKEIGFDDFVGDESNRLAALVVSDLALPILNICEAAKLGLQACEQPLSLFGERLAERSQEISFQIELIKRFIAEPERQLQRPQNGAANMEYAHDASLA